MKRAIAIIITVTMILSSIILLSSCSKKEEVIKIGVILPLSGEAASYGVSAKNGIELALEIINKTGNANKIKIQAIYEDTKGDPKLGVSAVRKLISIDKVDCLIGDLFSSVTLAVAPIANEKKIVLLSPASSSPRITNAGDYIFRNCPSDVYEGTVMSNYAFNRLEKKKIAVLYTNNDYGLGIKNVFVDNFQKLGGNIIAEEMYDANTQDFKVQLLKISQTNPDAVYIIGYKEMGNILKQSTELGLNFQFLSTVMFENPEILEIAKTASEGVIYSASAYSPDSKDEIIQEFVESYKNKYNQEPDIFAGLSYDAMRIMNLAIENSSKDNNDLKTSLYGIKNYPGIAGNTTFDKDGDAILSPVIKKVENGQFVFIEK